MRLFGFLLHHRVSILVDSGSTHNFLDMSLLSKIQLRVNPTPLLQVKIADGTSIQSCGQVNSVTLWVQGHSIVTSFYLISLGGWDIVLGVEWIRTLSLILWDFTHMTMQYTLLARSTTLMGVTPGGPSLEEGTHFIKSNPSTTKGLLLKLLSCDAEPAASSTPAPIQDLLHSFAPVFATPIGFPPSRAYDHRIILFGSQPVNFCSYRYPYLQKTEIEKIIGDLLLSRVIHPSQSPFSAPVLLVRKADGSWWLCVDYRALNHETVKDK